MRPLVGSIKHLRLVLISNVYLLDGGPGDRFLVDTGHWSERASLLLELRRAGIRPSDLTGVLLTHRHSDHAGNARFLQEKFRVPIFAHRSDADVLSGVKPREVMVRGEGARIAGLIAQFENYWPSQLTVDRALDDGDTIGGVEVHWIPGHTEGSVFFRHVTTSSLLSGDSLLTAVPPLVMRRGFALPYSTFSKDLPQAIESVRAFHRRGIAYDNLLAGHGRPLLGSARRAALEFLEITEASSPTSR